MTTAGAAEGKVGHLAGPAFPAFDHEGRDPWLESHGRPRGLRLAGPMSLEKSKSLNDGFRLEVAPGYAGTRKTSKGAISSVSGATNELASGTGALGAM